MWWTHLLDWQAYQAAIFALLAGKNPYTATSGVYRFFYPPWALIFLMPFAFLTEAQAFVALSITSMVVFLIVARRLKLGTWGAFFLISNPLHLFALGYGNAVWLPWIGLLLPGPLALVFLSTKPHVALGAIIVLLFKEWDRGRWLAVLTTLAPTAVLTVIWLVVWGLPPGLGDSSVQQYSTFPWSLIIGLPMLALAIHRRSIRMGAFAGPFLLPVNVSLHGYLATGFLLPFWSWVGGFLLLLNAVFNNGFL